MTVGGFRRGGDDPVQPLWLETLCLFDLRPKDRASRFPSLTLAGTPAALRIVRSKPLSKGTGR